MSLSTKKYITWEKFEHYCSLLADKIRKNQELQDEDFKYDMIVCIPRGGLSVALMLSYMLDIHHVHAIGINPTFFPDGANVLLVDTLTDSGETFEKMLALTPDSITLHTATLIKKECSKHTPNYSVLTTPSNEWIVWPWEFYEELNQPPTDLQ